MRFDEFSLIDHFIAQRTPVRQDVRLGIGDDCALVTLPAGYELAVSLDTLVAGTHFSPTTSAYDLGYKAVAVNLSDLAAMGAEPAWVTLALTLPEINEAWLKDFFAGFFGLIELYNLQVIGGDTTRGPLSITLQVHGFIPFGKALRRDGAKPGDRIFVTGELGRAGLALQLGAAAPAELSCALLRPQSRIKEGIALRDIASSAIDISDGLAADLGHILQRSHVGAKIKAHDLPIATILAHTSSASALQLALSAGDDYELCFTVAQENISALRECLLTKNFQQIGVITEDSGFYLEHADGICTPLSLQGYRHF